MRVSLHQKAMAAICGVCLLALISVGSSLWFAAATENDAAAINVAGSLRMQSWRLTEQVLIPELVSEEALLKLIDVYDNSINSDSLSWLVSRNNELGHYYRSIHAEWQQQMRPLLLDPQGRELFIKQVPEFVDNIDVMVKALQSDSESKLKNLVIVAVATLLGILIIGFFSIRFIRKHLLNPISDLSMASRLVSIGHFSNIELPYRRNNEVGQLTQAFSDMSTDLSRLYDHLEDRVAEKTEALATSNQALELLYTASHHLSRAPYDSSFVSAMLKDWQSLLKLDGCHLCLSGVADSFRLQKITLVDDINPCQSDSCQDCIHGRKNAPEGQLLQQFNLSAENHYFGFLRITTTGCQELSEESQRWLQTFADILATSLYQSSVKTQQQRLLLMEERAVIARELHDSLAQALSYQKIQVVRLKRKLAKTDVYDDAAGVLDDLQNGVSSAYIQLRELLKTFRLTMADGDLEIALNNTIDEYCERQPGIELSLDYQLRYCKVEAHHQIHALQIVREALTNVIKHANASKAVVKCFQEPDGRIVISIEDNGIGLEHVNSVSGHYGTTIMQERAASLDGQLSFKKGTLGGTEVYLEFEAA
ncbi:hypothetical protein EOPP23_05370 [Endozoicomonas sp. OPT23]|uniref:type IV pili methyl-accepting chemotaxis transducer N-terminal domain-containing protein n=1 Tax=Endozoicomonas sp. OPT23 TaxID=2072845 RepID=UPI00129A7B28|nr:type IV pili methyl-accepting chemotaxis transducer N-terminal domain-containing protein [Endozoicomonas sp. OPT23]MRI32413.1 hypothetical protein [Endozoicomonas sp. OPT23]